MWLKLSLRARLGLLLSSMLILALGTIVVLQVVFASLTLEHERALADQVASQLVRSLGITLSASDDPENVRPNFWRRLERITLGLLALRHLTRSYRLFPQLHFRQVAFQRGSSNF